MKRISYFLLMFMLLLSVHVNALSLTDAKYDGFNITEENFAKIDKDIGIGNVDEFSMEPAIAAGTTATKYFEKGNFSNVVVNNGDMAIYYVGPLTFGTESEMHVNELDISLKLRWSNKVLLYDGTKADLQLDISDIKISLGQKSTTAVDNADNKYYYPIIQGNSYLELVSSYPLTGLPTKRWTALTDDELNALKATIEVGSSYKITLKVLKHGTNEAIDTKYRNMAFGIYDLDIMDKSKEKSTDLTGEQIINLYNGPFAESVELTSGFNSPIHMAKNEQLGNKREQVVIKAIAGTHEGIKIVGDGTKFSDTTIRVKPEDDNTYYSGFVTMATPQSSTFYWTGSICGTALFTSQDVKIIEKHNLDGIVSTTSYGNDIKLEKIDEEEVTEHMMGTSPIYSFPPKDGYYLVSVTVDGTKVNDIQDNKYQFDKLVYNPLVKLNAETGARTDEKYVKDHKIVIEYAPNPSSITVIYEDGGGKDGIEKMPDEVKKVGEDIDLSENKYLKNDYYFVGWKVYIESNGEKIVQKDDNNEELIVKDKGKLIKGLNTKSGDKIILVAQWSQLDVPLKESPRTGFIIPFVLLLITSSIGLFTYNRVKNKRFILKI